MEKKSTKKSAKKTKKAAKPAKASKKDFLRNVPAKQYFHCADGVVLKNLLDLALRLDEMHYDVFRHHVNEHRNDFSAWIEHSIKEPELAKRILHSHSMHETQKTIFMYIIERLLK